jgi:hypothetical protein
MRGEMLLMLVQVNFYKVTGKWYDGGVVDIGDVSPYQPAEVLQAIVKNQKLISEDWFKHNEFYVVVDDMNARDTKFCKMLLHPDRVAGILGL